MRNGDHTAHVALTTFTILRKPKCLQISSGHSCVDMCKMAHRGQAAAPHEFSGTCSSSELWMWPRVPVHSTGNQALGHSSLPSPLPAAACDFFSRNLGNFRDGEQEPGKAGFCTWSGCFHLQSVPPVVERKCYLMSPLCVSTGITLGPQCWGKLRWVPIFGQHLEPTALGALQHPKMSIGDRTPQRVCRLGLRRPLIPHALKKHNILSLNLT